MKLSKYVFCKKCGSKLIFFDEFFRKIQTFFNIENWHWKYKFHDFLHHFAISVLLIFKKHLATFDFICWNEACVKCGTHKRHIPNLITERRDQGYGDRHNLIDRSRGSSDLSKNSICFLVQRNHSNQGPFFKQMIDSSFLCRQLIKLCLLL